MGLVKSAMVAGLLLTVAACGNKNWDDEPGPVLINAGEPFSHTYLSYSKDGCAAGMPAEIKIIEQPQHGRLEIGRYKHVMDVGGNKDHRCYGREYMAGGFVYRPDPKYKGPDRFVVEVGSQKWVGEPRRQWRRRPYDVIVK
ncbi:hypothetical protein [Methylobrevis pamukkalensis]|uniref:Lipoprotein n=1 Tax=Methylobrevis pamukkalensis TaxID=1439726 RepID=A0A1E3H3Q6_9HYPH|nr:hypothetical protein [Methylobrevis pamukkalensis]ODN70959.1 hypothetical protein A6302_01731 [Methylobrevis pamukkalensis]